MKKEISDSMVWFFQRVIEVATTADELMAAAEWIAEYCQGDDELLDFFKEECLSKNQELKELAKQDNPFWMMSMSEEMAKA